MRKQSPLIYLIIGAIVVFISISIVLWIKNPNHYDGSTGKYGRDPIVVDHGSVKVDRLPYDNRNPPAQQLDPKIPAIFGAMASDVKLPPEKVTEVESKIGEFNFPEDRYLAALLLAELESAQFGVNSNQDRPIETAVAVQYNHVFPTLLDPGGNIILDPPDKKRSYADSYIRWIALLLYVYSNEKKYWENGPAMRLVDDLVKPDPTNRPLYRDGSTVSLELYAVLTTYWNYDKVYGLVGQKLGIGPTNTQSPYYKLLVKRACSDVEGLYQGREVPVTCGMTYGGNLEEPTLAGGKIMYFTLKALDYQLSDNSDAAAKQLQNAYDVAEKAASYPFQHRYAQAYVIRGLSHLAMNAAARGDVQGLQHLQTLLKTALAQEPPTVYTRFYDYLGRASWQAAGSRIHDQFGVHTP